jgi:hypothetical protein
VRALIAAALLAAQAGPIPEPFREAVARDARAGLRVAATREATSLGKRFLAVVFAGEEGEDRRLKVYFVRDGEQAPTSVDLYAEQIVEFGTYEDPKTVVADLNGDGRRELIVSAANGGNCWQCSRVLLYSLESAGPRLIASEPMRVEDLDGDGRAELLVGDTRWEAYDDFSHAAAPGGTLVYTWREGAYVFAGSDAAAFYDKELAGMRAELAEAARGITADEPYSDERYLHYALSIYLVNTYTGRLEAGREELRRLLAAHAASDEMRARRKRILDDFLSGESATWLESPRKGDRLKVPERDAR